MIAIIPADSGKFRNVIPAAVQEYIEKAQKEAWDNKI